MILYSHLPPITKTIQIRRTRHAGHCWRSKDEHILMYSSGPHHTDEQKLGDQLEPISNNSVLIQDLVRKTCRESWTIEIGGRRVSGKYVLVARHDDDSENKSIKNYKYTRKCVVM